MPDHNTLTCPDTLLAVACALELAHVAVGVDSAQEHRLELVHARIGEQQSGVVQGHLQQSRVGHTAMQLWVHPVNTSAQLYWIAV
jgi:hypothetical protein